jgi:hypothetical protein
MKTVIIALLCATVINAGRISQWSSTFMLREPINTIFNGRFADAAQNRFDMDVRPNPYGHSAVVYLSGVAWRKGASLRIYKADGRQVANLSGPVQSGGPIVVWNASRVPAGMFFARLQSGARVKIVKFILTR